MDTYMGNKIIIVLLLAVLLGCDKRATCNFEGFDTIGFEGFTSLTIKKVSIKDLKDQKYVTEYLNPTFDSIGDGIIALKINQLSSSSLKNGFNILINDSLEYKITDVEEQEIYTGKNTMWGKIYACGLKGYKLNDSLIESHSDIIIYNK